MAEESKESKEVKEVKETENSKKENKKNKKKNKRNNFKGKPGVKPDTNNIKKNDSSFYYVNEQIGSAIGNIPYNVFAGQKIDLGIQDNVEDVSEMTIPGILTLNYANCPGYSESLTSAVNVAARAIYSWVRHQNSGHSNYEAVDLMMYILAMDEIYTQFYEARRILNIAMTYDYVNRNIPDLLLQALNVSPDSIRNNIAQFRGQLNLIAAKISSLAVPNSFKIFYRHAVIARSVFLDSSSVRGQFYAWKTSGYRVFDPTAETGGQLQFSYHTENRSFTDIVNTLNTMLDAVLGDEDMNIMSGDILKAYGRENLIVMSNIDENETAQMLYDEDILAQIENSLSTIIPQENIRSLDVTQNNNTLIFKPIAVSYNNFSSKKLFNSHKDNPDWKDNLEWSRGMSLTDSMGTECVLDYSMYTYKYTSDSNVAQVKHAAFTSWFNLDNQNWKTAMADLTKFDWHPMVYAYYSEVVDGTTKFYFIGVIGEVKKFTVLDNDTIKNLNDSAVMGEFNALLLSKGTTY